MSCLIHNEEKIKMEDIGQHLGNKYKIIAKIGEGSFGEVYTVTRDNCYLAAKVEDKLKQHRIEIEYKVYKCLHKVGICKNIPNIYDYIETPDYNILTMELLGDSLEDIFNLYNKKFRLQTVFMIAYQLIYILNCVHRSTFIHRDIKPNNFLFDTKKKKIYIMDFGLAKKYYSQEKHIKLRCDRSLIGTARYASINMHLGLEPSRRDDMESLGYMLIYFAKGVLPWQGLKKSGTTSSIQLIGDKKISTSLEILCNGLPPCFYKYIKHCRDLAFNQTPDYKYLLDLFIDDANLYDFPIKFEWS